MSVIGRKVPNSVLKSYVSFWVGADILDRFTVGPVLGLKRASPFDAGLLYGSAQARSWTR